MTDLPTSGANQAADAPAPEATEPGVDTLPVLPHMADGVAPKPRRRRRSLAARFGVAFLIGVLLAVGIGAGALYAWARQYDGRVLPGVSVGSTYVGGQTRDEATATLTAAYGSLSDGAITLTGPDGQTTTLAFSDVDRGPDTTALVDAAFAAGRDGNALANLVGAPRAAMDGVSVDAAVGVKYDHDKLAAAVAALAGSIDQSPSDAAVTAVDGTFSVTPATEGRAVDQASLLASLDQHLAAHEAPATASLDVPVGPVAPAIPTASAEAAKAAADRMVADVVVARGEDSWTIKGTTLAPLVSFTTAADGTITPVLDEAGLDPIMKALAPKVRQKVRDASLKLVNGHVIATGQSREGRTLDQAGMKAAVITELAARQSGAAATPVAAVVKFVEPKLTTADAEAFAPRMKAISSYRVYYWVIINNHWGGNIEGPATVINGTVVPAGTKFDFWKVVGDLHDAPGVGPGNAIEGGKITVTGAFGGGICTTSTTLFNAAFRAGMIPLARKNHNEFIDRYPPGLDATVWIVGKAKQTMSFKNDTDFPILITRTVTQDGSRRWLKFIIWSVPNHRTAKVTNTVIDHGPSAHMVTVKDPSKPVGYYYLNNSPADGAKVWTTVSIYDHGKLYWRKRYFSNYPAVDGVTIVGTKPRAAPAN